MLPRSSLDLNPTEQVSAKPRDFLRKAAARTQFSLGYLATQVGIKTRFVTAADLVLLLEVAQRQDRLKEALHQAV